MHECMFSYSSCAEEDKYAWGEEYGKGRASLPRSDHTTRTRRAGKGRGAVARRLGTTFGGQHGKIPAGASGVAAGDGTGLWQGLRCPRIAQRRRVGRLEPKLHSLGVAGQFGHVVESAENARRERRACQTEPPRAHGASARRWLGLVRVGPEEAACEALQGAITHHDQRLLDDP